MVKVGGFIAAVAVSVFIAATITRHSDETSLLTKGSKIDTANVDRKTLAVTLLTSVLHSTSKNTKHLLRTWRDNQIAHLNTFGNAQVSLLAMLQRVIPD